MGIIDDDMLDLYISMRTDGTSLALLAFALAFFEVHNRLILCDADLIHVYRESLLEGVK